MLAESRYTRTAITLHWLIAALMVVNVLIMWLIDHFPDDWVRPAVDTHKSIGITVLGLAILRLLWRYANPPPPMPASYGRLERMAAHAVHMVLYLLMFLLPLSGWMHDSAWKDAADYPMRLFGLVPWPRIGWIMSVAPAQKEVLHDRFGALHTWAGWLLYGLFVLHVAGALKHQFMDRERELQRMMF